MSDIQTRLVTTTDINNAKYVITPGETLTGNFADIMGGKDLDGVVQLSNDCTGTLLSSGKHILTAGHCLINEKPSDVNVIFRTETGNKVIASKQLFIHPSYNDTTAGNDIAIIELVEEAPLSASRYDIYRDQDEIGKTFLKVGYGLPGKTKEQPSLDDGKKRAGLNTFEAFNDQFDEKFDTPAVPNGTQLVFDYDNGLVANDAFGKFFNKPNLGLGLDEVNTSRGDSGGPAFINGKIAGITSDGIGQDAGVTTDVDNVDIPNSSFGEFSFDNRVSIYANWIDSIVNNTQPVSGGKKSDFNDDDKIDIVWQNSAGTQNQLWLMNNSAIAQKVTLPNRANINWKINGTGDFDGDGKTDILLRNYTTGGNQVWLMNGTSLKSRVNLPAQTNLDWTIEGTADFNQDGSTDILLRNYATGNNQVWLMNRTTLASRVNLPAQT
ncbi:MAG: trypsin-like serine protease, partial [Microcoleaceae cyanobacterium]